MRDSLIALLALTAALATAWGADEFTTEQLAKIRRVGGDGLIVWQRGGQWNHGSTILCYDLDFDQQPQIRELGTGIAPALSDDGSLVAFFECASRTDCDLVVMKPDGSDKRTLNSEPIKYAGYLKFTNNNTLVFTAGPTSVRDDDHAAQQVWECDLDGNMTLLVDETAGSDNRYAYASFVDKHDDWVTWRYEAYVYIARYAGEPLRNSDATIVRDNNACAQTFNPTGDTITTNGIHHNAIHFYHLIDGSWQEEGWIAWVPRCVKNVGCEADGARQTSYRWSNRAEWMVARRESWGTGENDSWNRSIVALNIRTVSGQKETGGIADDTAVVQMTIPPSHEEDHAPNLYIASSTTTAPRPPVGAAVRRSNVTTVRTYTIRGRMVGDMDRRRGARGVLIAVDRDGAGRRRFHDFTVTGEVQ